MVGAGRPFVLLDIGANPDSTAENLAQYARMGAIFSERVLGVETGRASRCCRSARRRARAMPGSSARRELLDETDLNFIGNVEGKDLTRQVGRRRRLRRGPRQRRDQVLRGPVRLHLRPCCGPSSAARSAAGSAYLLLRPGIDRGSAPIFDYEVVGGSPLLGVRGAVIITHGRAQAAHDRARGPRRGHDGARAGPGADRRGARAPRCATMYPTRPARPSPRRQAPDVHPVGRPRRDPGDGAPGRARGARA